MDYSQTTLNGARLQRLLVRNRLLAERSRESLRTYFGFVFRHDVPAHVGLVIECLQAVAEGQFDRLLIVEPPGHAKSTIVSLAFPTWYLGRHREQSLIGATTTGTLAELYADSVADLIEYDEDYAAVFPNTRPDKRRGWSREGLFVTRPRRPGQKDPSLVYAGAGGPIIGRRADGVILDDVVDQDVARSETRLKARVAWAQQTIRSRLKPSGWLVLAGTIWAEDDVIGWASTLGTFVTVKMVALSESRHVDAIVTVPDGIAWKPRGAVPYDGGRQDSSIRTNGKVTA